MAKEGLLRPAKRARKDEAGGSAASATAGGEIATIGAATVEVEEAAKAVGVTAAQATGTSTAAAVSKPRRGRSPKKTQEAVAVPANEGQPAAKGSAQVAGASQAPEPSKPRRGRPLKRSAAAVTGEGDEEDPIGAGLVIGDLSQSSHGRSPKRPRVTVAVETDKVNDQDALLNRLTAKARGKLPVSRQEDMRASSDKVPVRAAPRQKARGRQMGRKHVSAVAGGGAAAAGKSSAARLRTNRLGRVVQGAGVPPALLSHHESQQGSQPWWEQEEIFESRPAVRLGMPDNLKSLLVDDWENVTKNVQLVSLPVQYPVNTILDHYLAHEQDPSTASHPREPGSPEADLLDEFVQGLREYFEKALGRLLLYRLERDQYAEVRSWWEGGLAQYEHLRGAADVYGAEHLLRLFGKCFEIKPLFFFWKTIVLVKS